MDIHGICPLLQVFDMPTAIRFYRDVLGFQVYETSQPGDNCNWAWLKLNGADLMLNTAYETDQRPAAADPARIVAHDDTCLFFGCKDLDTAYQHLLAHGVNLKPPKRCALRHEAVVFSRSRRLRPLLPVACKPGDPQSMGARLRLGTENDRLDGAAPATKDTKDHEGFALHSCFPS